MNHFEPSAARARDVRSAMDSALWASVRQLLDGANDPDLRVGDVRSGPTDLLDYGAYFDLVLEPPSGGAVPEPEKQAARAYLLARLAVASEHAARAASPRITNFSGEDYSVTQLQCMTRWLDIEPANRMAITTASESQFAHASAALEQAMAQLQSAAPELHEECNTVVRDIVLSRPDGTNLIDYGGASSFALWGAFTVNTETQREWTWIYRQLVHEAGHNLLFGIAREEPLVGDDASERHASPVRADARPMDGVFHAAFVSAREALSFDAILSRHEDAGHLSHAEARTFEGFLQSSVLAFWDCVETLRGRAQLTGLGAAVLGDCEDYMRDAFAVEPA